MADHSSRRLSSSRARLVAAGILLVVASASARTAHAQSESPTGGGTGCVSNGNCQGSVYKDKSNLDRWWYNFCSNCHVVKARQPVDVVTTLTSFQKDLISDKKKFYAMHDRALTDPVLKVVTPKASLLDARVIRSPYRELLTR